MITHTKISSPLLIWYMVLSLFSSHVYSADMPQQAQSVLSQEEQEALELAGKCEQAFQNIYQLKNLLTQIANTISHIPNSIIKDKKTALEFIRDWNCALDSQMNDIATATQAEQFDEIPHMILSLIEASIACTQDVSNAMRYNFKDAQYTPHTPNKNIIFSLEAFDAQIIAFEESLTMLSKNALSIGLTFTNKVVRKIDDFVSWCGSYHLGKIAALAGLTSVVGTYLFWHHACPKSCDYALDAEGNNTPAHQLSGYPLDATISGSTVVANLDDSEWNNWFIQKLTGTIGLPPARINGIYQCLDNEKGYINSTDAFISNLLGHQFPPQLYAAGGVLVSAASYLTYEKFMPGLKRWFSTKWNHLKGGAYTDKKVEGVFEFYPTITFDDVIGMEEYKERFKILIEYCVHPEHFHLAKNKPCTRIAFTGPTRTGKTYLAHALCGAIAAAIKNAGSLMHFRFLNIPGDVALSQGISGIMAHARSIAPCVIFIDEIDLCNLQRGGNSRLLMDALTELGTENPNSDPLKPIITIVATNKLENLDTALFTPARLGEDIRFDYPCIQDRVAYISHTLRKAALNPDQFDIVRIAQKVNGKSFEDMSRFITAARSKALIEHRPITQELFEHCIDEEIRRIIFFNRKILPKQEMLLLSAHFAGETLATALLQDINILDMVTINPFMPKIEEEPNTGTGRESWQQKIAVGKMFTRPQVDTTGLMTREQIIKHIKCLVAGSVAEEIVFGYPSSNMCEQDSLSRAYEWAKHITFGGIWKGQMADAIYNKLSEAAFDLFVQCKKEVRELLEEHREQLDALIHALMIQRTLSDGEVYMIMQNPSIVYQAEEKNTQEQPA